MAKKRAPSPPLPAESSEEESGSSSAEEEEIEEKHPTKSGNPNPNEEELDGGEEEEEEEEEEEVEEEEEEEEEEESAEEEDDSNTKPAAAAAPSTAPATAFPSTAAAPKSGSGSGSDSESESDSDSAMVVKPISSKPMPEPGVKKSESEKSSSSSLFQRVWSLDDEIALLNGVLDFKNQTGSVPPSTGRKLGTEFPSFIKKYLHMDASEVQVSEKIRRLRKKYDKIASRSSPQFATPHDRTTFEISAKIWGEETTAAAAAALVVNGKESPSNGNGYPFLKDAFKARGWDFAAVMALENLDPGKARALEEKFKKQKMAAMKHHLQRMELQKETFKLVMDGMDKTI